MASPTWPHLLLFLLFSVEGVESDPCTWGNTSLEMGLCLPNPGLCVGWRTWQGHPITKHQDGPSLTRWVASSPESVGQWQRQASPYPAKHKCFQQE